MRRTRGVAMLALVSCLLTGCTSLAEVVTQKTYRVNSMSMEPTLKPDTRVTARLTHGGYVPRAGDIIVFTAPEWSENPDARISRVIGIPGSRVECCAEDGRIRVDGRPLDEPYLGTDKPSSRRFVQTVPQGRLWVMSDHRDVALDSRAYQDRQGAGTVAVANVIGVIRR